MHVSKVCLLEVGTWTNRAGGSGPRASCPASLSAMKKPPDFRGLEYLKIRIEQLLLRPCVGGLGDELREVPRRNVDWKEDA